MIMKHAFLLFLTLASLQLACSDKRPAGSVEVNETNQGEVSSPARIPVILDSDANNELDDQHAIAYLLFNGDLFDVRGITVNRTRGGGDVNKHYEEAERVVKLCQLDGKVSIYKGAEGNFPEIQATLDEPDFDGAAAVNFIIEQARAQQAGKLVLIPIGKLTNIALALEKAPDIAEKVRIVWLGSNYPDPGEYNQENDTASMSYVLQQNVPFEMVTVRYGKPSGSDAVRISPADVEANMKGKGPQIDTPVAGRHGGSFTNFGDYAYDLFQHIDLHGDPPSRALFDVVAVAVVKNPSWGESHLIPAPRLVNDQWQEQPENPRKITVWENFDSESIILDFYDRMDHYVLAGE
jgi:hypothetical protein